MTLTVLPAPKLDPGIEAFYKSWEPAVGTKDWSKGTSGCWYDGPLSGIEAQGIEVPAELEVQFAERQRLDYIDRGVLDPAVLTPGYAQTYDSTHHNLWDPLHFNVSLLGDLAERGFPWAAHYLSRVLFSYYVSKNQPWLRDGGQADGKMLYSNAGRHRILGWAILALLKSARVYKLAGRFGEAALCLTLIEEHVDRAIAHYPLRDDGQNDGLKVPHCRVFMTGHLLAALRRVSFQGGALGTKAAQAFAKYSEVVKAARRGPGTYVYDVAWDDATKVFYEHPEEVPRAGIYTVNCWLVDAIGDVDSEWRGEFESEALATQYPQKRPIDCIAFFGSLFL